MKRLFTVIIVFGILFSFVAEASVPLTKDNQNTKSLPKFIRKSSNSDRQNRNKNPHAESSFSGVIPSEKLGPFLEMVHDDRRRREYFSKITYVNASTKWIKYVNKNSKYFLEYPDIFSKEMPKPADADGLWIESSDGNVKLTTLDEYNVDFENAQTVLTKRAWQERGRIIKIKKETRGNWYRFVYHMYKTIVYRYGIVENNIDTCFILGYPDEKEEECLAVGEQIERSFGLIKNY